MLNVLDELQDVVVWNGYWGRKIPQTQNKCCRKFICSCHPEPIGKRMNKYRNKVLVQTWLCFLQIIFNRKPSVWSRKQPGGCNCRTKDTNFRMSPGVFSGIFFIISWVQLAKKTHSVLQCKYHRRLFCLCSYEAPDENSNAFRWPKMIHVHWCFCIVDFPSRETLG